jgi:hypothetical protein
LLEEVSKTVDIQNDNLIICGDFNLPKIDWLSHTSTGNYNLSNPFLYKIAELSLEQHIFCPTHNRGNILDLVLTNKAIVGNVEVFDPILSDHSLILINLNISQHKLAKAQKTKIYQYNKADLNKGLTLFKGWEAIIKESINNGDPVSKPYGIFLQGLNKLKEECVPSKLHRSKNQPDWFTNRVRNALKKQKHLYTVAKVSDTVYNINRYKTVRKLNKRLIKQAKKSYLTKTLYKPLQTGDSKSFYRYIRQNRENGSNIVPDLVCQNVTAKTSMEKANILNQFFESVFVDDDGASLPQDFKSIPADEVDIVVSPEGVLKLLKDIDVSKSCGPDNITGILLKTFAICIKESLTQIFRYSLLSGSLPDIWRQAKVKAIYKKGNRHSPNNYRPVSLTCITCKILEHIISSHVNSFLSKNDILTDSQHGFRSGRSCETQLVYTFNDLAHNREEGLVTDVLILDFSKAFDTVNHRKLLFKLNRMGINAQVIIWISAFLKDRKQTVMVDGMESAHCGILSGVPQGSVLGPLLFLLYVNDLPAQLTSECRLFADDALVYNTRDKHMILQEDLQKLETWSHTWQLAFNASKCSVLSVGDFNSQQCFSLNNIRLQNVSSHPYLGIELSNNLKWEKHINNIVSKATRLLGMLSRVLKTADTKTRQVAYNTLVRPVLEYGCQVWDPYLKKDIKRLEQVQNKALRFIFRIKGRVSFTQIRKDANVDSLEKRRRDFRLKLFVKSIGSGVISNTHDNAPQRSQNTRQRDGLYVPAIKTNAFFHSFWPRTTRDARGDSQF